MRGFMSLSYGMTKKVCSDHHTNSYVQNNMVIIAVL